MYYDISNDTMHAVLKCHAVMILAVSDMQKQHIYMYTVACELIGHTHFQVSFYSFFNVYIANMLYT